MGISVAHALEKLLILSIIRFFCSSFSGPNRELFIRQTHGTYQTLKAPSASLPPWPVVLQKMLSDRRNEAVNPKPPGSPAPPASLPLSAERKRESAGNPLHYIVGVRKRMDSRVPALARSRQLSAKLQWYRTGVSISPIYTVELTLVK